MSLANRLKELRRAVGWTQQDLSRVSGLTRSYISRLEMGDIALPSSEKLRALAQSLGTSPDDLLQAAGYIDNPAEATELPELKVYLRRKYAMQDARTLQALETIVYGLQGTQTPTDAQGGTYLNGVDANRVSGNTHNTEGGEGPAEKKGRGRSKSRNSG